MVYYFNTVYYRGEVISKEEVKKGERRGRGGGMEGGGNNNGGTRLIPCARARYAFEGQSTVELSFSAGVSILLLRRIDANWLEGELEGKVGIFPANHVDIELSSPSLSHENELARSGKPYAIGLFDFAEECDEDLPFAKGELIEILGSVGSGWMIGKTSRREGIFPASFVEILKLPNTSDGPLSPPSSPVYATPDGLVLASHSPEYALPDGMVASTTHKTEEATIEAREGGERGERKRGTDGFKASPRSRNQFCPLSERANHEKIEGTISKEEDERQEGLAEKESDKVSFFSPSAPPTVSKE